MAKRVFLLVLDSLGIGGAKDADKYGDQGSNTLLAISKSKEFKIKNLKKLGLFNIDGNDYLPQEKSPIASYARVEEESVGKDSTTGHWEHMGIVLKKPLPLFCSGFPAELIQKLEKAWGRKILCNKAYSGTEVIKDYGQEHERTGSPIVYTSADSVLQIACHTDIISLEELYDMCEKARKICRGKYQVARIIARPFIGKYPNYVRTPDRHDYNINPPKKTVLDELNDAGYDVISVGKIASLFNNKGITQSYSTKSDEDGIKKVIDLVKTDFNGFCFANLVDFDTQFGHRNNVDGYAKNLSMVDGYLKEIIENLNDDDYFLITADHGCDPSTPSTDHSRENVPLIVYNKKQKPINLHTLNSFTKVGEMVKSLLIKRTNKNL